VKGDGNRRNECEERNKAVVPVVQAGKVEIVAMSLENIGLRCRRVFQIASVQFRIFGNSGFIPVE
jgi:hypothetical protein